PGTPWFDDATAALAAALDRFDFDGGGEAAVRAALEVARARDALTVWHLVARVEGPLRREVVARLAALSPAPPGVGEDEAMRLDPAALDAWRRSLATDVPVTW